MEIPARSPVSRIESVAGTELIATRMLQDIESTVAVELPAVLTVDKGVSSPPYPTLQGIAEVRQKHIAVRTAQDLGVEASQVGAEGSPTRVVNVVPTKTSVGGVVLEGTLDEQVLKLAAILKEHAALDSGKSGAVHE